MVRWPSALLLLAGLAVLSGCGGDPAGPGGGSRDAALIEAARRGDTGEVRRLLDEGASVTARDPEGATALVAAAYGNHLEPARALVAAGADVNLPDGNGVTPLAHARQRGQEQIAGILREAGARP